MSIKPLYIYGDEEVRIKKDCSALRVSRAEKADVLFPLRRISKVICKGRILWDTEAMLLCLDFGIGVYFMNSGGDLRASCIGISKENKRLETLIYEFASDPQKINKLETLSEAITRRAILMLPKEILTLLNGELRPIFAKQRLDKMFSISEQETKLLNGMLDNLIYEKLLAVGIPQSYISERNVDMELIKVFNQALSWELYRIYAFINEYKKLHLDKYLSEQNRFLLKQFEVARPRVEKVFMTHWLRFEGSLREFAYEP